MWIAQRPLHSTRATNIQPLSRALVLALVPVTTSGMYARWLGVQPQRVGPGAQAGQTSSSIGKAVKKATRRRAANIQKVLSYIDMSPLAKRY